MPGAVTKPKTSPWKVTAQNVEERIKFNHHNSRTALALSNAKIHRPGSRYLPKNGTSSCSINSSKSTVQLDTALCNRNFSKTKSSKRTDRVECKGTSDSKPNKSETLSSDASGRTVTNLDSRTLRCSCKIAMDAAECKKSGNSLEETKNLTKSVKLKVVEVNPWTNDGVKTARDVDSVKSPERNLTRLVSLLQECDDVKNCCSVERQGTADTTPSCQADDGTSQHTSQKLIKPRRIVHCSHRGVSADSQVCENCLPGILLVSSKIPSNPWPVQQLSLKENLNVPPNKVKSKLTVFERGPRFSTMKKVCQLCKEYRNTYQNVSLRIHGPDMESENLTRLKCKLKLKERELLSMESNFGRPPSSNCNEPARDEPTKFQKLGEKFTLPKLYLTHHSTAIANHPKAKKTRTKMTNSIMSASEECSNATKQRYCKLESVSSPRDKLAKNSRTRLLKVQGTFSAVLMPTTPLRGFTPLCLTESPMLWRENESAVEDIVQEKI